MLTNFFRKPLLSANTKNYSMIPEITLKTFRPE